jgi:hypothetical protein
VYIADRDDFPIDARAAREFSSRRSGFANFSVVFIRCGERVLCRKERPFKLFFFFFFFFFDCSRSSSFDDKKNAKIDGGSSDGCKDKCSRFSCERSESIVRGAMF